MKKQIELTQKDYPLSLRTVAGFLMNKQGYTIKENYDTSDKGEVFIMESKEERMYTLDEMKEAFGEGYTLGYCGGDWNDGKSFEEFIKTI